MRKIFSILLSLVLMSTLCISLNVIEVTEVEAAVSYAMSCSGTYELAWVNDSGGFDKVACYSTFAEAKTALATKGDDYVIRHDSSLSPTKIIAINSGIAYSYPKRSSSSTTLTITQNVDYHIYRKTTYVTQHRELANPVTTSYNGSGSGTLTIDLVGFDGFVDVKDVDLIPMKFITNGLSITIGGNTSDNSEDPFTIIPRQSYFEVVQNGNYTDVVYHYFSGWALGGYTAEYTSAIGPASDWMSVGDIYYSYDHETYYSDRNYTNYVGEYYSYYQFLPARSTTSISASTFDSYMNSLGYTSKPTSTSYTNLTSTQSQLVGEGQTFINNQNSYGVNALLVYALACLESGNGRSQYAVERNNLFGWNAVDSDPDQASYFSSISQGVMEQMAYNLRNYLDVQNAVFFGMHFGNKGSGFNVKYAADPYWGIKVAAIAYSIDKLDNNYDGTLTDYNKYDVGIVETYSESVYKNSDGTYEIHTTEYGATYQKNYTVILLESMSSGYMKTQLANMYINGSLIQSTSSGVSYPATAYDFSRDIGYIDSDSIKVITSTIIEEAPGNEAEGDFILETSEIALYDSNLEIIGLAYQPGIYLYSLDDISHQLLFVDQSDDSETSFDLTTVMLGPTNYVYGGFIGGEIDVMQFSEGIYQLYIKTTHDAYTDTSAVDIDIDLTYSYYGYDYHIYSTSSGVVLEVSERELDIEHAYNTLLSSATISDEGILSLYGVAMVEGYNNSESSIKHELEIINADTNETVDTIALISHTGDYDLSSGFNHYLDYSYGWYKGEADLSNLGNGNYSFIINTTVKGQEFSKKIYTVTTFNDVIFKPVDTSYYSLSKQYTISNRLDLSITNYMLPDTETDLPSVKESYSYISSITLDEESSLLKVNGSAIIWKASFSDEDEVSYKLSLANTTTGDVFTYHSEGLSELSEDFSWDNNNEVGGDFDLTNTWFEFEIDMNELTDGTYVGYLILQSNDLISIVDLTSQATIDLPSYLSSDSLASLTVTKSIDRSKILMDITGFNNLVDSLGE